MNLPRTPKKQLQFWKTKLKKYQDQYNELKKQSPDRWWHDEHFDNQMKVLENSIATTKQRAEELKGKIKDNS